MISWTAMAISKFWGYGMPWGEDRTFQQNDLGPQNGTCLDQSHGYLGRDVQEAIDANHVYCEIYLG